MQTSATNRKMRVLLTAIRDGKLIPNPRFQRRLVWSSAHKVAFLRTVLEGLPFPEIFISAGEVDPDTGDGTELIVDGQQRITTLYEYFTSSPTLKLPADLPAYAQLTDKIGFLEYEVVVRDLGQIDDTATRDLFQRINSTRYSLTAMEVNNARFDGALKQFAESLAAEPFFINHSVFSGLDGRRMNDTRFALTVVITLLSGYFNRDDDHEFYLSMFNDEFPAAGEIGLDLHETFTYLDDCSFVRSCRIWQKADLLTALVEVTQLRRDSLLPPSSVVRERLTEFFDAVERITSDPYPDPAVAEYYRRVRSGINDRMSRLNRASILREFVLGTLSVGGPTSKEWQSDDPLPAGGALDEGED